MQVRTVLVCALVISLLPIPLAAQDPTAELAMAPKVRHRVRLQFTSDATKQQGKFTFEYAIDSSDEFKPLDDKKLFAASDHIKFTWPRINPLRLRLTASRTLADDPNAKQLAEFVETLLKLPTVLSQKPTSPGDAAGCPGNSNLAANLEYILEQVEKGRDVPGKMTDWLKALDSPGPAAARAVVEAMGTESKELKTAAAAARRVIEMARIRHDALRTQLLTGSVQDKPKPPPTNDKGKGRVDEKTAKDKLSSGPIKIDPSTKKLDPAAGKPAKPGEQEKPEKPESQPAVVPPWCDDFEVLYRSIQALLGIQNPIERVVQLEQAAAALDALQGELRPFANDANWEGIDYVFFSAEPVAASITSIQIKAVRVERPVDQVTNVITLKESQPTAGTLNLRRYSRLVPEVAAGFVTSTVRRPKYGTGTGAAGETIVARKPDEDVSFSAALLLNAVLAPRRESFALPMVQLGVSVAPEGPGVLAGVGLRLTRPKRVALSVGAVLAWVKDLQTLQVGGPVSGTAAIDADLRYEPTVKPYFALQYKF